MSEFEKELERKFQRGLDFMDMEFKKWLMEQVSSGMRPCDVDDDNDTNEPLEYYKDISLDEVKKLTNKYKLTDEQFVKRINSYAKNVKMKQIYDEGSGMEFGGGSEILCLFYTPLSNDN